MAVEIFIARHGQNEDNANGVLNGHRDLPLTELGRQQARSLGEGIKETGLQFEAVYSSPLLRALETARIARNIIGIKAAVIVLPELIERDFGVMTGRPQAKISEFAEAEGFETLQTGTINYFLDPEGAETFPQLVDRAHGLLETVRCTQPDGNALLVCHGDFGKMIYAAATGKPWDRVLMDFHFGNGELIEITPNDDARLINVPQHNL